MKYTEILLFPVLDWVEIWPSLRPSSKNASKFNNHLSFCSNAAWDKKLKYWMTTTVKKTLHACSLSCDLLLWVSPFRNDPNLKFWNVPVSIDTAPLDTNLIITELNSSIRSCCQAERGYLSLRDHGRDAPPPPSGLRQRRPQPHQRRPGRGGAQGEEEVGLFAQCEWIFRGWPVNKTRIGKKWSSFLNFEIN